MDHPVDFEHNLVRVYSDDETKRAYRVPSLIGPISLEKRVGDLIDDLLANETCPLHGSPDKVDLFEVLVTNDGKQFIYLPHAKPLTELVAKWVTEAQRKSFVEVRLMLKAVDPDNTDYASSSTSISISRKGEAASGPSKKYLGGGLKGLKTFKVGRHHRNTSNRGLDRNYSAEGEGDFPKAGEMDALIRDTDFGSENFNPEEFSSMLIKNFSDEEIRYFLDYHLISRRDKASKKLKSSVRDNYTQFIETANEVEHLENDMLELRNHLTEVNTLIKGLQAANLKFDRSNMMLKRDPKLVSHLLANIHWLLELPDMLDILTSERLFSEAILELEKARELITSNPQLTAVENVIKNDLNLRIKRLSEVLLKDLAEESNKKSETQKIIDNLTALGFVSQAREVFLETRASILNRELRKLSFDGDLDKSVNELARLVFTMISSTCDEFVNSFPQNAMRSGFVVWSMKVIKKYSSQFNRVVFKKRKADDWDEIARCYEITKAYCKELDEKGLSFMFHLRQEFFRGLLETIESWEERVESSINGQLAEEIWESRILSSNLAGNQGLNLGFKLTESGAYVYNTLVKFASVIPICSAELLPIVANTLAEILEKYFFELSAVVENRRLQPKQYLAIVANARYLCSDIVPKYKNLLAKQKMDVINADLDSLQNRIDILYQDIQNRYCQSIADDVVNVKLDWANTHYHQESFSTTSAAPLPKFVKLFDFLGSVGEQVREVLGPNAVKELVSSILELIVVGLSQGPFWHAEADKKSPMFSQGGVSQFILDCKFSLSSGSGFLTEKASSTLNEMIERALISYCSSAGVSDPRTVMQEEDFYKRVIRLTQTNTKGLSSLRA